MLHDLTKLLGAAALAAALGATPALARESISEWDEDGDGVLTEEEFEQGWGETEVFGDWDTDGDGILTEGEYRAGVFNTYDADGDGELDEEELGHLEDDLGEDGFWDW